MACCNNDTNLAPEQRFGVLPSTPCHAITIDLLQLLKDKIDCYLRYSLWGKIESTQAEMQNASLYLQGMISQKMEDDNNCAGIENLWIVRQLVDKIITVGVCL